jgi:hypothetical protein
VFSLQTLAASCDLRSVAFHFGEVDHLTRIGVSPALGFSVALRQRSLNQGYVPRDFRLLLIRACLLSGDFCGNQLRMFQHPHDRPPDLGLDHIGPQTAWTS